MSARIPAYTFSHAWTFHWHTLLHCNLHLVKTSAESIRLQSDEISCHWQQTHYRTPLKRISRPISSLQPVWCCTQHWQTQPSYSREGIHELTRAVGRENAYLLFPVRHTPVVRCSLWTSAGKVASRTALFYDVWPATLSNTSSHCNDGGHGWPVGAVLVSGQLLLL